MKKKILKCDIINNIHYGDSDKACYCGKYKFLQVGKKDMTK